MKKIFNHSIIIVVGLVSIIATAYYTQDILYTSSVSASFLLLCFLQSRLAYQKLNKIVNPNKIHSSLKEAVEAMYIDYHKGLEEAARNIELLGQEGQRSFINFDSNNVLVQSINTADQKVKEFNEQEAKRKWAVEGIAKFGELLRTHDIALEALSHQLISGLVRYIDANQGGVYLLRESENHEKVLHRVGCFAYDRKRLQKQTVGIHEGLLGQCYLDKETLYITDVPSDYVQITSGLGEATPKNIVIVPLLLNDQVYGVLELATFNLLEAYHIKFLEQIGENVASVFSSLLTADKTKKLLQDSQHLTTELQSSEEEMRQNMEELAATQEEMDRKQTEIDGIINAINNTLGLAEINPDGELIYANSILAKTLAYNEGQELTHLSYKDIIGAKDTDKAFFNKMIHHKILAEDYLTKNRMKEEIWLNISFSPMFNANGDLSKVLLLARDITERKLEEIEFEKLSIVANNTNNSVVITDAQGSIEYVNHGFTEMTGYTEEEVMGKKPGNFLQGPDTNQETINKVRKGIRNLEPVYEEILNYRKDGESYWISMAINPVFGEDGVLEKYISIQANITETKKSALDLSYKLQAISKSNAIIEFDTTGHILDANENFLSIFGYEKEEIIGTHHKVFVPENEVNSAGYLQFWEKLASGEYINDEFQRVSKEGDLVWLRGIYNPIYDINGKPYKIVKFAIDITAEKQLKIEKQKNQAELDSQMAAINKTIASVEFDLVGNIIAANDIFLSITGFNKAYLNEKHYLDIIPAQEKDKPQTQLLWQNLGEGKFFSGEFKFMDCNHKELWLNGTFSPISDWEGNPYKVMMYAQFNTDEKEKQKNLMGTVNALKNTTPILELNPDGTFKNANELFFNTFGYKRLELRRRPFSEFIKKSKGLPTTEKILEALNDHQFVEFDIEFLAADGQEKGFRTTFSPIFDLEEQVNKIVIILIDRQVVLKV